MLQSLPAAMVLVPSYDEGQPFFRDLLGFAVLEYIRPSATKRWVVITPSTCTGAVLVLAVPSDDHRRARVGDQTGGRVGFFPPLWRLLGRLRKSAETGRQFPGSPCREIYGLVAVFVDPWGGKWDLLQPATGAPETL